MPRKPVIKIGYLYFACPSVACATSIAKELSRCQAVEREWDGDGIVYHPKKIGDDESHISLELAVQVTPEKKPPPRKRNGLPMPNQDAIRCAHCEADVVPGEHCPACGRLAHHRI